MATLIDYNAITGVVREMTEAAKDANSAVSQIFFKLNEMKNDGTWKGKYYDALINVCNLSIPIFNDLFSLVVTEIPGELSRIGHNYSDFEGISQPIQTETPTVITEATISNSELLVIDPARVVETKDYINQLFTRVTSDITKIDQVFNTKLLWEGPKKEEFKTELANAKTNLIKAVEEMQTAFVSNMTTAIDEFNRHENA